MARDELTDNVRGIFCIVLRTSDDASFHLEITRWYISWKFPLPCRDFFCYKRKGRGSYVRLIGNFFLNATYQIGILATVPRKNKGRIFSDYDDRLESFGRLVCLLLNLRIMGSYINRDFL